MTNNWAVKRLDEISTVTMGQSPPSASYNGVGQGVPFFQGKPSNIDNLGVASPYQYTTEPTKIVTAGTALMTVRAPVGEFFSTPKDVCIGRGLSGIKANEDVSQRFLNYHLQYSTNQFHTLSQGTTFSAINSNDLKGIKVVLPPQSTQQKIADILSTFDQAIQKTDQIIQKTEVLKQGLLQELLTKGIGHKKFKKTRIGEIPEEWEIVEMNKITKNITDGKHGDCSNEANSGYYFVSVKDIRVGQIDYTNVRQITKKDFEETHKRTKLEAGDLLLTNSGTIGRMAVVPDKEITTRTTFQKSVAIIKPDSSKVNVYYMMYALTMVLKSLITASSGSAQANLLLRDLRSYKIPLPSLEEQQKIAGILAELDTKLDKESKQKASLIKLKNGLMQDIFSQEVQIN